MQIQILGRGPVALALGLWLTRQGFDPARIALDTADSPLPTSLGARSLALSAGSWQLLARICAPPESAPIVRVEVSLSGRAGRTRLSADELGLPALGRVVRYAALVSTLRAAAAPLGFAPPAEAGRPVRADTLVVHAEGQPGDDAQTREFDQTALVAEVELAAVADPMRDATAFECFTQGGPLALLPLPEPGRFSLVWCARPDEAARRSELDDTAFLAELSQWAGQGLVATRLCSPPQAAPLARRQRRTTVQGHEVWIGNAAQTLHPVAGQGLNLGLRDAFELARELGRDAARTDTRPAPPTAVLDATLARYRRSRLTDRQLTVGLTDALARLFTVPALAPWQSLALGALDLQPRLRRHLAQQMMFGRR